MLEDSIVFYGTEELELWLLKNNSNFSIGEINKELERREIVEDMSRGLSNNIYFQELD